MDTGGTLAGSPDSRLMAARPDKRPGQFKREANRVGSYQFAIPELVRGTLERGFALGEQLTLPFTRAAFMMFLISAVHPSGEGNGRLARLAMNAELTAAGQHRILVPLIVRNDYLAGPGGDPRLLVRVLANAWRWPVTSSGPQRRRNGVSAFVSAPPRTVMCCG